MPTILITGASSGLGLQFLQHYVVQPSYKIIALDIQPINTESLIISGKRILKTYKIDITSTHSIQELSVEIKDMPIDMIIHCAGIRGLVPSIIRDHPGDVAKAETIEAMDTATMLRTFEVNTVGTFNLIKSLLPNLLLCAKDTSRLDTTNPPQPPERLKLSPPKPKVVIMSSRMGSISSNDKGGGYAYRASKAALNAVVKSLSIDVPEVGFLLVHPGRVETGLVPWKEAGAMDVSDSIADVMGLIEGLSEEDERWKGGFVDRWGKEIWW